MNDNGWDWADIHVITGEWWLFTICLAALLLGLLTGYLLGQAAERKRWQQQTRSDWDDTPGAHRAGGTWDTPRKD